MSKCRIRGCDRDVGHKESGLCKCCYAFMHYWSKKTVTQQVKHVDKLHFWDKRAMQLLMPKKVAKRRIG